MRGWSSTSPSKAAPMAPSKVLSASSVVSRIRRKVSPAESAGITPNSIVKISPAAGVGGMERRYLSIKLNSPSRLRSNQTKRSAVSPVKFVTGISRLSRAPSCNSTTPVKASSSSEPDKSSPVAELSSVASDSASTTAPMNKLVAELVMRWRGPLSLKRV